MMKLLMRSKVERVRFRVRARDMETVTGNQNWRTVIIKTLHHLWTKFRNKNMLETVQMYN